ncbi:uncharacterized protein ELE39_003109 [Cryptosporidium sp. chipmunk genotype I]|uniref:uncharacterized protein n=1 Tax=Cryptosporidium sp. chipmunk genotype I TaxID=1280935 RepID=UPI00351AA9A0|nr:hypothetical protein ELE39_003109 [Cryptosporidium sp. chipmunk genotype I]
MSTCRLSLLLATLILILSLFDGGHEIKRIKQVEFNHSLLNLRRPSFRRLLRWCFGCCGNKCKKKRNKPGKNDQVSQPLLTQPGRPCLKKTGQGGTEFHDYQSSDNAGNGGKNLRFEVGDPSTQKRPIVTKKPSTPGGLPSPYVPSLATMMGVKAIGLGFTETDGVGSEKSESSS